MQSIAELYGFTSHNFLASMLLNLMLLLFSCTWLACKSFWYRARSHFKAYDSYGFLRYCNLETLPCKLDSRSGASSFVCAKFLSACCLMHCNHYVKMVKDVHSLQFLVSFLALRLITVLGVGYISKRNVLIVMVPTSVLCRAR